MLSDKSDDLHYEVLVRRSRYGLFTPRCNSVHKSQLPPGLFRAKLQGVVRETLPQALHLGVKRL